MNFSTSSSLSAAIAAATLFLAAPMAHAGQAAQGSAPMGHCMGANACKGQGACKTAANACKGQNACKGKGFTMASAEQCKTAGGRFEMPKAHEAGKDAAAKAEG